VSSIGITNKVDSRSPETERLLKLWDDVERSSVWRLFAIAAAEWDYEKLKDMGDMFWHV
jgi:hypothetical protein